MGFNLDNNWSVQTESFQGDKQNKLSKTYPTQNQRNCDLYTAGLPDATEDESEDRVTSKK